MMWFYGTGWGGMLGMSLGMLLWFAILGMLTWGLVNWITERQPMPAQAPISALEILQQRYARGEIDEITYHTMRDQVQPTL